MSLTIGINGENLIENANGEGAPPVVLHISDLHFGWEGSASQEVDRTLCLRSLVQCLHELDASWKPTIVCVTGDIGWRGAVEDYQKAREWLLELLTELNLPPTSLLLCPGNHDSDRKLALSNVRPSQRSDAERVLQCPLAKQYLDPFGAFEDFCRNLGVPPYLFDGKESYIVGFRRVSALNFVCLNSAWFSQGDNDKGSLWLGLPQIRLMEAQGHLPKANSCEGESTITLLHHPREWYHEGEISALGNGQPNTFDYLCHRSHAILTGHTHGEVRAADQYAEFAWHLSGGAAFAGASHFNSFRLIKFESDALIYRSFEFDPRASNAPWGPKGHARSLPLGGRTDTARSDFSAKEEELEPYQYAAKTHAERLLLTKSRSITPFGTLPPPLPLSVVLHSAEVPPEFADDRRLLRDKRQEVTLTFLQAIRSSRRSLLLGDMGTGKSTLAAELVSEIIHTNRGILPVLIEAKAIQLEEQLTIARLLDLISAYANAQTFPALSPISVQTLLNRRNEILIIVDGLDEMPEGAPNLLLRRLYELPDHWPNIHVVATGRPVELAGVSFTDWQVIFPAQLSDQDKLALLKYEAMAEGKPEAEATRTAEALYAKLYGMPVVNAVATTPLFVRLLYSRLSQVKAGEVITIGDLLYDLAKQRAGGWAKKDQKSQIAPLFEDSFPSAIFRIEILALLALALKSRDRMTRDEAIVLLDARFRSHGLLQGAALAEQALEFFSSAGLLLVETFVAFPSQSLLELFQGVGIATNWKLGAQTTPLEEYPWRAMSFACAVLRSQGQIGAFREKITAYLEHLLGSPAGIVPAAYVIAEALDAPSADRFLDGLKALPQHSLHIDWEAPGQSAQAVAIGLQMAAGGFEWFYEQYLDPRYPFLHRGSAIVERIFTAWAALPRASLSDKTQAMLSAIVRPHILAGSHHLLQVLPTLAVLVPDAFTADERLWFRASLLENDSFREIAISELIERHKSDAELVDSLLLHLARDGNSKPAALWCELNPSGQPNAAIMRAHLLTRINKGANPPALEEWSSKLDKDSLLAFARWAVFDERPSVAAGAAIMLFESENAPFSIIGRPLLRALHDGGYIQRAEEVLDQVIEKEGRTVLIELADEIAATENEMHGAHSGWWRLFLKHIGLAGNDAPDLLRSVTGGVGCFLLARHPEIRQALRDLLTSGEGHKFTAALRDQLYSVNPPPKHGAAMILLVVSPETEAMALEIVVQLRSRETYGSWHEWEEYLLTLSLGPSVLQHLHARYSRLDSYSQVLALAILARKGIPLTEPEQRQLHIELLSLRNWNLARHVSVEKAHAIQFLVEGMDEDNADVAARAATELLNRYSEQLSAEQLAKAIVISGGNKLHQFETQQWLERYQSDPDFQKAYSEARAAIHETGREDPLFSLCCDALTNNAKWADIIWRLFFENRSLGVVDAEEAGQWLLEQAQKSDTLRTSIGSATTTFLEDPRVRQNRWTDTVQWLAVVADECSPLPEDKIQEVLFRHPEPIYRSAAAALIARLGKAPEVIISRDRIGAMPDLLSLKEQKQVFSDKDLANFVRSSETLHPDLCPAIEACLLRTGKTQQLDQLAVMGATGALVAAVFSYLYSVPPQLDWIIRYVSLTEKFPERPDRCRERLIECWRASLQLANREEAFKLSLIERLHNALEGDDANFFFLAWSIFRLRKGFTAEEAAKVVAYYAGHPGYYDYGLIVIFCEWLVSSQLGADEISSIVQSLERALVTMDGWAWEPEHNKRTCYPLLLFPVSSWCLTSSLAPSELSVQVFLKGLRHLFTLRNHRNSNQHDEEEAINAMSEVINVVGKAPKSCLRAIALAGIKSDDAIVRTIARFLSINSPEA